MIAIIPAKSNSERVINKNYRPFYNGKSLCDIQIEKLLKIFSPADIYLSCDDISKKEIADKYKINFVKRSDELTRNEMPIVNVIKGIYEQIDINDDVMWCQVTDPLFNNYKDCLRVWKNIDKNQYDSLVVINPYKQYLLNEQHIPINFQFGAWHQPSQKLSTIYRINFAMSILSSQAIRDIGYYIGCKPYWYEQNNIYIDIDSDNDWHEAQFIYEYIEGQKE